MRAAIVRTSFVLCALASACGSSSKDTSFLSLDDLCAAVAEDICAPKECCKVLNDETACIQRVRESCETDKAALVKEASRSYDAEHADEVRAQQRNATYACHATLPVSAYFENGLAKGKPCQRDSQCASGACEGTCIDAAGPARCNDTEGLPPTDAGP